MPQARHRLLEGAWGHARRLTINVARNSLSLATALRFRQDGVAGETVFLQWRCACWND
jgi:hypothetical protein